MDIREANKIREKYLHNFAKLEEKVRNNTINNFKIETENDPLLSPKAKKAKEIIKKGNFGCRKNAIAELISVLLDEEIKIENEKKAPPNLNMEMAMVVIEDEDIGKMIGLCYVAGNSNFSILQHFPNRDHFRYDSNFRKATSEEMDFWFESWKKIFNFAEDEFFWYIIHNLPSRVSNAIKGKLKKINDEDYEGEVDEDDDEFDFET
jgi:hypothetical protein